MRCSVCRSREFVSLAREIDRPVLPQPHVLIAARAVALAVFEATDIAKGPVALAHLSSKVPAGFHGNWLPS